MIVGPPKHSPLGRNILVALRQSCAGHRLDVAEHLINGLEVLAKEIERCDPEEGRMLLDEGYRVVANQLSPNSAPLRRLGGRH